MKKCQITIHNYKMNKMKNSKIIKIYEFTIFMYDTNYFLDFLKIWNYILIH